MLVVFRVDASLQIGTGHVMRCLTFADLLARQGHKCWFICREHDGHLGALIASKGHGVTLLSLPGGDALDARDSHRDTHELWLGVPWQEDARQTLEVIAPLMPDWLVVDHYALDANWECTFARAVGNIMVIDDLAKNRHECTLLLDQNLGRKESDYNGLLPAGCQRLIGPSYALLRPEFAELREQSLRRRQQPELKRLLISLGGVDRTNVTGQVLAALAESTLPRSTELDIIMGVTAPYLDEVRQQADRLPFKTTVSVGVNDMAERMCLADLSIGAVGTTSWERCCLGLPAILMILADNQKHSAQALSTHGVAVIIQKVEEIGRIFLNFSDVGRLSRDLSAMSYSAEELVDGHGCWRVASSLTRAMPQQ